MTLVEYVSNILPTLTESEAASVAAQYNNLAGGNISNQAALLYGEGPLLSLHVPHHAVTDEAKSNSSAVIICPTYTLVKGFKGPSYKVSHSIAPSRGSEL